MLLRFAVVVSILALLVSCMSVPTERRAQCAPGVSCAIGKPSDGDDPAPVEETDPFSLPPLCAPDGLGSTSECRRPGTYYAHLYGGDVPDLYYNSEGIGESARLSEKYPDRPLPEGGGAQQGLVDPKIYSIDGFKGVRFWISTIVGEDGQLAINNPAVSPEAKEVLLSGGSFRLYVTCHFCSSSDTFSVLLPGEVNNSRRTPWGGLTLASTAEILLTPSPEKILSRASPGDPIAVAPLAIEIWSEGGETDGLLADSRLVDELTILIPFMVEGTGALGHAETSAQGHSGLPRLLPASLSDAPTTQPFFDRSCRTSSLLPQGDIPPAFIGLDRPADFDLYVLTEVDKDSGRVKLSAQASSGRFKKKLAGVFKEELASLAAGLGYPAEAFSFPSNSTPTLTTGWTRSQLDRDLGRYYSNFGSLIDSGNIGFRFHKDTLVQSTACEGLGSTKACLSREIGELSADLSDGLFTMHGGSEQERLQAMQFWLLFRTIQAMADEASGAEGGMPPRVVIKSSGMTLPFQFLSIPPHEDKVGISESVAADLGKTWGGSVILSYSAPSSKCEPPGAAGSRDGGQALIATYEPPSSREQFFSKLPPSVLSQGPYIWDGEQAIGARAKRSGDLVQAAIGARTLTRVSDASKFEAGLRDRGRDVDLVYVFAHGRSSSTETSAECGGRSGDQALYFSVVDAVQCFTLQRLQRLMRRLEPRASLFSDPVQPLLRKPIVLLFACDAGVPGYDFSVSSLPTEFLANGASAVLASELPIDVLVAEQMSRLVSKAIGEGDDIGLAVYNAKRELLHPSWNHNSVIFFSLYGKPSATLPAL